MKRYLPWIPPIFVTFVFVQSLFFKFSGSEETVIIFNTIADWMAGLPVLGAIAEPFRAYGGNTVGFTELVAAVLILVPRTRIFGALLGVGVISGAIFFHLFTPLGVDRVVDAAGNTDGGALFAMACGVWIACLISIVIEVRGRSAAAAEASIA